MSEQEGPLPPGWTSLRLDEIAEVRLGRQRSPERATGDHMCRYLRAGNITWNGLALDDVKEMDFTPTEQAIYRLVPGDILMSEASGSASEVGKPAVWNDQIPGACFQNTLLRVRPPRGLTKYLFWHLMADAVLGRFVDQSPGVGIHHLGATRLSRWPIRLAPEGERQAIAEEIEKQLTRIDAGVAALKSVQANLKRYRASVLNAACEGRLVSTEAELARRESRDYEPASALLQRILKERRRHWEASELAKLKAKGRPPTDDRWKARYRTPEEPNTAGLPDLPAGWCWSAVEQLCETVTDGDHQPPPQVENGVPFLVIGNIREGAVNLEDCRFVSEEYFRALDPARSPRRGDVLYSVTGSFGLTVLVEDDTHFCVQRHIAILRPSPGVAARYLVRALSSNAVFRAASAIATGTAQKTVPLTGLRRLAVPLPPGTEQQRIAEEIDRRFTLLGALEKSVSANQRRATGLRQSLLGAAFEGKLVRPTSLPFARVASPTSDVAKRGKRPTAAELSDV